MKSCLCDNLQNYCELSWKDIELMDKEHRHPKSNTKRYKSVYSLHLKYLRICYLQFNFFIEKYTDYKMHNSKKPTKTISHVLLLQL